MKLMLSKEDIASLSDTTKYELAGLMGLNVDLDIKEPNYSADIDDQTEKVEDLTSKEINRFMGGVSDKTKKVLQLFAEYDGETTVSEVEKRMGENFHWAGFMSGVTRRLRNMPGHKGANFFQWEEGSDYFKFRKVFVSPMTCESLKTYFSI